MLLVSSGEWAPEQVIELGKVIAQMGANWRPQVPDACSAGLELAKINEILREHGFEYPLGARGVADLAHGYRVRQEALHELDPEHWAAAS